MIRTEMLAEIGAIAEAEAAIEAGADILSAPAALAQALVAAVGGRCRTAVMVSSAEQDADHPPPLLLATVFYADQSPDLSRLPALAQAGYAAAVMTVSPTSTDRLLRHADPAMLQAFALACRRHGLAPGFGGRLELPDVPRLLLLTPALLCVSGAPARLRQFRALITPPEPASDGRTDRIFVHDMVLPVRIGAYAQERTAAQPMRFSVDALVTRARTPIRDMRDIISYDIISDSIRLLVAAEHVELVEVLAERIAAVLLGHRRVVKVSVMLEKLETGSGVVGVAIERTREDIGELP